MKQLSIIFLILFFISCNEDDEIKGCMDELACNYNSSATINDNNCTFAENNKDCNGVCLDAFPADCDGVCGGDLVVDCTGECGGNEIIDACGECGGLGIPEGDCDCFGNTLENCDGACPDCTGECNGIAVIDECGVCNGIGIPEGDCDCFGHILDECGVCAGNNSICTDECGIINGNGIPEGDCDCEGNQLDCNGDCGGSLVVDCEGECGGDAILDICGECNGNGSSCNQNNLIIGVWQFESNLEKIHVTTNTNVVILDDESPGTGSIEVIGAYNVELKYLDIDEYGEELDIKVQSRCDENLDDICYEYYFYEDGNSSYFYIDGNDLWYSFSSHDGVDYSLDGFTLSILNDQLEEWPDDSVIINGELTGATIDIVAGVSTVIESDQNFDNDDYDEEYLEFNSDHTWSYYELENCHLYVFEEDCNDEYNCNWDDLANTCINFDCSEQEEANDCWDGPCDWDDQNETCIAYDDSYYYYGIIRTWEIINNQLILSWENEYYSESQDMIFDFGSDEYGNLILNGSQNYCYYYDYYDYSDYSEECIGYFADEYYGLEADHISEILSSIIYTLSPSQSRDINLENKSFLHALRATNQRLIKN